MTMDGTMDDVANVEDLLTLEHLTGAKDAGGYFRLWDRVREEGCPVQRVTVEGHSFWLLTRYDDIRSVMQQPDLFSNHAIMPLDPEPAYQWIPEMIDPPEHTWWRKLLAPVFTPAAVEKLEPAIRSRAVTLVEELAPKGSCELDADFAQQYPTAIFLEHIVNLPVADTPQFLTWSKQVHTPMVDDPDKSIRLAAMEAIRGYFADALAERKRAPQDDLLTAMHSWEVNSRPVTHEEQLNVCLLLMLAGLETVALQLNYAWFHLATHQADRRRVVEDPAVIPSAVEELLRAYTILMPARKATRDVTMHGETIRAGEMVWCPLNTATRDPRAFPDGDRVVLDRAANRHLAFGLGPHRCVGSHLARLELNVAMEEWHRRIPDYHVPDGAHLRERSDPLGSLVGLSALPLEW